MKAFHEVRRYEKDFMAWHGAYRNMSFYAHWHEELELIYIRSGSASIHIDDRSFEAEAGDLLLCASGSIHFSDSHDRKNLLEFIVFGPHLIGRSGSLSACVPPHIPAAVLESAGLTQQVKDLFELLPKELEQRKPYYQEIIQSILNRFWYSVRRAFPDRDGSAPSRRQDMLQSLQRVLAQIDARYQEPMTLGQAARMMNFSECHFSRIFRQYTGMNYVTYLNMVRIERAAAQLRESPARIVDIAYSCGFNNVRTFNRVFRQMTGCCPTEYQKNGFSGNLLPSVRAGRFSGSAVVENDSFVVLQDGKPLKERIHSF